PGPVLHVLTRLCGPASPRAIPVPNAPRPPPMVGTASATRGPVHRKGAGPGRGSVRVHGGPHSWAGSGATSSTSSAETGIAGLESVTGGAGGVMTDWYECSCE